MQKKRTGGFSLLELLIVVTIMSIIAAIGYPSYTGYIVRGKRAEARAALMDIAARQERYYSDNNRYVDLEVAGIEPSSENGNYNLSINLEDNGQDFTLRATPTFSDQECGHLELERNGSKGQQNGDRATCWGK